MQTLGFKRPFISDQSKGLYRPFAEIDLFQLIKLSNLVINSRGTKEITKALVGEIEPLTTVCVYEEETFFSIFAEQGIFYEVVFDQIKA